MKLKQFLRYGDRTVIDQTLNFYGADTEQRFINNIRKIIDYKIDTDLTYQFNNYGFRSNQFTDQPNIIFIGCSHTLGIGVKKQKTFSYLISKHLNLAENNLAIGGSSNDAAFRLASFWLDELKPKIVVWLVTYDTRLELIDINQIEKIQIKTATYDYYLKWVASDENRYLQKQRNILAVKQLCDSRNIKLLVEDADQIRYVDKARDLSHPGKASHRLLAEKILNRL